MANQNDMRILYDGIEGKTSIDEKSGLNIKNDLIGVAKKLNQKKNRPRISFELDNQATKNELKNSLNQIIKSIKLEPIKIKFDKDIKNNISSPINSKSKIAISDVYNIDKLKKEQIRYISTVQKGQKMINIITKQLKEQGLNISKVDLFSNAKGNVKSFTAESIKANGAVEKLNFTLSKLQYGKTGKKFSGFVQTSIKTHDTKVPVVSQTKLKSFDADISNLKSMNIASDKLSKALAELEIRKKALSNNNVITNEQSLIKSYQDQQQYVSKLINIEKAVTSEVAKRIDYTKTLLAIEQKIKQTSGAEKFSNQYQNLNKQNINLNSFNSEELIGNPNAFKKFKSESKNLKIELSNLQSQMQRFGKDNSFENSLINDMSALQRLNIQVEKFGNINDKFTKNKKYANKYDTLKNKINIAISNKDFTEIRKLQAEFKQLDYEMQVAGKSGQTFSTKLGAQMQKLGVYFSAASIMMAGFSQLRQMISYVKDIDTAMVSLKKVTNLTDVAYINFLNGATERAKKLGATLTDVIDSTSAFSRLGYNIEDSIRLGDASVIFKNVADGYDNIAQSNESLISAMQAFGIESSKVMQIVDKYNEVGNRFATTSSDVGEGMKRSASALVEAGNTIDEGIALFTAGQTVLQDADSMGTILKTTTMRLRGATNDELLDAGADIDGMIDSTAKLRAGIKDLTTVDIMINDDTFKSTYQILKEISSVWDKLTDVSRANVLEQLAGKRNGNALAAILNNFDIAEKVLNTSINSNGSALKEHDTYLDSIAGKTDVFLSQYQTLSDTVINSDFIKVTVDTGTGFLGILTKIINTFGSLSVLAPTIFGIFSGITNAGLFRSLENNNGTHTITFLDKTLKEIKEAKQEGKSLKEIFSSIPTPFQGADDIITDYNNNIKNASFNQKEFIKTIPDKNLKTYLEGLNNVKGSMAGYINTLEVTTLKTKMMAITTKAATIALNMFIPFLIIQGVSLIVKGIDKLIVTQKELIESAEESRTAYNSLISELESLNSELEIIQSRIIELNNLPNLSLTEQRELKNLQNQNAELERQLHLKEALAEEAKKKANDASTQVLKNMGIDNNNTKIVGKTVVAAPNRLEQTQNNVDKLSQLKKDIAVAELNKDQVAVKSLTNAYELLKTKVADTVNLFDIQKTGLDETNKTSKGYIDSINKLVDSFILLDNAVPFDLTDAFNKSLTENTISVFDYEELLRKATGSGVLPADIERHEKFAKALDKIGISAASAANHINSITTATMGNTTGLDTTVSKYATDLAYIQEIEEKSTKGSSLAYDEKQEFIQKYISICPNLIDYIHRTADGWGVEEKAFTSLTSILNQNIESQIKLQIKLTQKAKEQAENRIKTYGIESAAMATIHKLHSKINPFMGDFANNGLDVKFDDVTDTDIIKDSDIRIKELEKFLKEVQDIGNSSVSGNSASKTKNTTDTWLEAFTANLATLQHNRQMDIIDTQQYLNSLNILYKKYFEKDGKVIKKYLEQHRQYQEEVYQGGAQLLSEQQALSERYISNRNTYNDWGIDSEIAALERMQLWLKSDYYDKNLISYKQFIEEKNTIDARLHNSKIAQYKKEQSALQSLYDTTKDMILQENELKIKNLEDELDGYKQIIEARKKELQLIKEKSDSNRTLAEKQKAVGKIEKKLFEIKDDDSASANAERLKLYEELEKSKLDLDDFIKDEQYQSNQDALDEELDAYEKNIKDKKTILEDFTKDAGKIADATMNAINNRSDELYKKLVEWNKVYGTGIESDIKNKWDEAIVALEKYQAILGTGDFNTISGVINSGANNENNSSSNITKHLPKVLKAKKDGSRPDNAKEGDYIVTGGGVVKITNGKGLKDNELSALYNPTKNYNDLETALIVVQNAVKKRNYRNGGVVDYTGVANLHGSKNHVETVFNSTDGAKLYNAIHNTDNLVDVLTSKMATSIFKNGNVSPPLPSCTNAKLELNFDVKGNLDKSVLPDISDMVNSAFKKFNESIQNQGISRGANKFSF